jgi:hypothetical protein
MRRFSMTNDRLHQLELRVVRLEEDIRVIRASLGNESEATWWQKTAGMFKDDEAFAEIVRLGRQIRRGELTIRVNKPRKASLGKRSKKNSGR